MTEIHRFQSEQEETIMPATPSIRIFIAAITALNDSFELVDGAIFPPASY
jgi:replication-associated recombination protein RarA